MGRVPDCAQTGLSGTFIFAAARTALVFAVMVLSGCGPAGDGANPRDAAQVSRGETLYQRHCASCHGVNLEGQANWKERVNGLLPAPPHDASGHTWHHPDAVLFDITKRGAAAVAGGAHRSDMPPFGGVMSDQDIWDVLAFIKSRWPASILEKQAQINVRAAQRR